MSKLLRRGLSLVGWLCALVLVLGLCCCAGIEAPACPAFEDWRQWRITHGAGGTAPQLQLAQDECGRASLLRIRFFEAGSLSMSRPLAVPSNVGLALETSCARAGYSLGPLHAPAGQGSRYYQGVLTGSAALAVRADEPCTFAARVEAQPARQAGSTAG